MVSVHELLEVNNVVSLCYNHITYILKIYTATK